jgi:mannitol-1-phosphate/altronate dehydrogenase
MMKRVLLIMIMFVLVGCGGIVLKRQLDRVQLGMSQEDVLEILGEPYKQWVQEVTDRGKLALWEYKKVGISISTDEEAPTPEDKKAERYYIRFLNGKVTEITRAVDGKVVE